MLWERGYERVTSREYNGSEYYLLVNEHLSYCKSEVRVQYVICKINENNIRTNILINDKTFKKEEYTKNVRRNRRKAYKKKFFNYLDGLKLL